MTSRSRFLKPGWIFVLLLLFFLLTKIYSLFLGKFEIFDTVVIDKGETISRFFESLSRIEKSRVKIFLYKNPETLQVIKPGSYSFSGGYVPSSFISSINNGPQNSYTKVTILEGRSMYDIDAFLTKQNLILPNEYLSAVTDEKLIEKLSRTYSFLDEFFLSKPPSSPLTLEGVLYPDTYHLDPHQNIVDQLIPMQLSAFRDKIVKSYRSQIDSFGERLQKSGYSFPFSFYSMVTLASIIEKEERKEKNKAIVSSIFLNRIQLGMRIDADISLCYGLKQAYEFCPPSLIGKSIKDSDNLYNTRVHSGLTPTPISSPSEVTFSSFLQFQKTDYLFYLHDNSGNIHYSSTIEGHNSNKNIYL